jgi:exopolysaccharide biosynthesis polyprenyl glycosylphosphotransferase
VRSDATTPVGPPRTVRFGGNKVRDTSGATSTRRLSLGRRRRSAARQRWVQAILLGADLVAFGIAVIAYAQPTFKTLVVLFLLLGLFYNAGLYRPRLNLSVLDDAPSILGYALAGGALAMMLGGLSDGRAGINRLVAAALFGLFAVLTRTIAYNAIRAARRRGRLQRRTLLLGAGTVAGSLGTSLVEHPEYGLDLVGLLDDKPLLSEHERPVPVLGGYDSLTDVVLEQSVDVVIVTFGAIREPEMVPVLRAGDRLACDMLFVPRLYELHAVTRDTEVLWGMPLVPLRRAPFRTSAWTLKRLFDVTVSGLALLLLAPVLAVCAVMSRLDTGLVLFRQTRIGLDGRPFTLLKFCSLRPAEESEARTNWNIGQDNRVRFCGRVLRRTSLDELPQLWNVLRGDMSLVGPRPERPYFVDEFARQYPWYTARHRVPAGLTGWAQVHGLRGDTSIADRARFDNSYIENWSLWGDVKILLRTAGQVLRAGGS